MKALVDKLRTLEIEISTAKGPFLLFALFLREDAVDRWDLVVSASWIDKDNGAALKYLAKKLGKTATLEELVQISRIVIIENGNPSLAAMQRTIQIEHGSIEFKDCNFFGLHINHAFFITSRNAAPA